MVSQNRRRYIGVFGVRSAGRGLDQETYDSHTHTHTHTHTHARVTRLVKQMAHGKPQSQPFCLFGTFCWLVRDCAH